MAEVDSVHRRVKGYVINILILIWDLICIIDLQPNETKLLQFVGLIDSVVRKPLHLENSMLNLEAQVKEISNLSDEAGYHNVKDLQSLEMKIVRTILPVKVGSYKTSPHNMNSSYTKYTSRLDCMRDGSSKLNKNRRKRIKSANRISK